jgi:hypothetical protein
LQSRWVPTFDAPVGLPPLLQRGDQSGTVVSAFVDLDVLVKKVCRVSGITINLGPESVARAALIQARSSPSGSAIT